ncbi:MAG: AAC(3) family N-acetyltransferase [Sedimentisphaerales bacterium]|nr:AAC(3) family N-acetyltransferase [Sedimentisphaerales bacterium]
MPNDLSAKVLVNKTRLMEDLKRLGIKRGDNVVARVALSKIGLVEGGPQTVIDSLIDTVGPEGSIFALSFTLIYKLPLSEKNKQMIFKPDSPTYTGAFNTCMLKQPKAIRSRHPNCSFVGIGPIAEEILSKHGPDSPSFDPVHKLARYDNSEMLLLGTVDQSPGITTVHVAQNILDFKNKFAGRYGVNYRDTDGTVKCYVRNDVGGCSMGFYKFYEYYRKENAVSEGTVGAAKSMLANLKKTLEIDLRILKQNPKFFFCDNPSCISCRINWEFSDGSLLSVKYHQLLYALKRRSLKEIPLLILRNTRDR